MSFEDEVFMPSQANNYITLLKNSSRGDGLRITTCHKSVFVGMQSYVPCEILLHCLDNIALKFACRKCEGNIGEAVERMKSGECDEVGAVRAYKGR